MFRGLGYVISGHSVIRTERFFTGDMLSVVAVQRPRYAEVRRERLSSGQLLHARYVPRLL